MFKNKNADGTLNICGKFIAQKRKFVSPSMSQRVLADKMQLRGIDLDKNAVQKIECGKRFVTNLELVVFAEVLNVSVDDLLGSNRS